MQHRIRAYSTWDMSPYTTSWDSTQTFYERIKIRCAQRSTGRSLGSAWGLA